MNKNAIKKFAIEARTKLLASVTDKAGMLGITEKSCSEPITKGADFEVYQTTAGIEVTLNKRQCEQRRRLVSQIESRGFEAVVEEVAYTWFNRICAMRFMEVNDYLPNRVRVLSSEKEGKMEPDLVTEAPDVDLDLTAQEKEEIINWKLSGTSEDTDKLYCKLFLKQCHQLHDILPGLFEADSDYMELLFGISYTNKDDVIYMLVNPETGIPENDFNVSALDEEGNPTGQVEIIGWLYQYYNTELKDDTFAKLKKNVKITKERIPAATQLFTPDWIVRYMVENSVGRIWIEHLRAVDPTTDEKATAERFGWKYYLPEAEQEEEVNVKLAEIRTTYKDLKPTDITCSDPCMGSGHILIAMFDVLMDIYESAGYDKREAAFEIVEHNIHGLDIDQRAYQLAYFAVMMKGRGYNRRFLRGRDGKPEPKVYAITESNEINRNHLKFFGTHLSEMERNLAVMQIEGLLDTFIDAREYGSILNVDACDWDVLERFVEDLGTAGQISFESVGSEETQENLRKLVQVAKNLGQKYDAAKIDFIPHQFRPVLKFIRADRPRLLIADGVGVGKTIEAGLILRELQARRNLDSVLIICPRPLVSERKWEEEMKRFGEEFTALDGDLFRHCINELDMEGEWPEKYKKAIIPYSLFDESNVFGNKKHKGLERKSVSNITFNYTSACKTCCRLFAKQGEGCDFAVCKI